MLVHLLYRLADKLDCQVSDLLPELDEIGRLQTLDELTFSENVSVEQRQQIARLLIDDNELPSASGGQNDASCRRRDESQETS